MKCLDQGRADAAGLQKHSRPAVTPLRNSFFANRVGFSRHSGIALLEIDRGIRQVEQQGVT